MTEAEAREKLCPQTMGAQPVTQGETILRWMGPHPCMASSCMAWRRTGWVDMAVPDSLRTTRVPTGYCGLAGPLSEIN